MTRIGSLCSGYGGLDTAAGAVTGGTVAWFADPMPASRALLAHHHPDTPNHGDLTATDWAAVEPVDVLTAGWPCQPWSLAGNRKGAADERAIWPAIARAVRDLRPGLVLLENVASIAAAGELARAVGDLAGLGYDAEWTCLRASDVGAPHGRNRCFVAAADADSAPRGRLGDAVAGIGSAPTGQRATQPRRLNRDAAADAERQGREGRDGTAGGPGQGPDHEIGVAAGRGDPAPDTDGRGRASLAELNSGSVTGLEAPLGDHALGRVAWGPYAPAIARWAAVLGRDAPDPTALGRRGGAQLSPAFVEWLMGLPAGWVTDVPGLTRAQQLTLLGNGVVPQQAEAAYRLLLNRTSALRITSDTVVPSRSARATAASQTSSVTRTVRRGVWVSCGSATDDEARVEVRDGVCSVLADDQVRPVRDGHGAVTAGAGHLDAAVDGGRAEGVLGCCHDTNTSRVMTRRQALAVAA